MPEIGKWKHFFPCEKIYSPSNLQMCITALLTIVAMLDATSPRHLKILIFCWNFGAVQAFLQLW